MNAFVQRHASSVMGVLCGWDRLRFRGTLRMLANVTGLFRFLCYTGHLLKDFGRYGQELSRRVRAASLEAAGSAGRPVVHLAGPSLPKEDHARMIAARDGVTEGLICVLTAVESCWSYNVRSNPATGRLDLIHAHRKCQHLYHYMIHPALGFMHVRFQTWLPFNMQVCVNGREILARRLDRTGIAYRRADNCFTHVSDLPAAQALLDEQVNHDWPATLGELAAVVNPMLKSIVGDYDVPYYWSLDESEWASDVLFRSTGHLAALYPGLVRHATESFASPEVMRFLGNRLTASGSLHGNFDGQVISDLRKRAEGIRVKHRVNRNSVKMYDKAGSVLRVETTLNNMRDIKAPRRIEGRVVYRKMRKGVADMPRRARVSQASNTRYFEALAAVGASTPLKILTDKLAAAVVWKGKRVRGLNPLGEQDAKLLATAGRGEFLIIGFRNRDLAGLLFAPTDDESEKRRRSSRVTRMLRMLRAHGLIHKVPHTHRYLVSDKGRKVIAALHAAREADIDKLTRAA